MKNEEDDDGFDALLALADNIENAPGSGAPPATHQPHTKKRPLPSPLAAAPPPPRPPPAARPSNSIHRDLLPTKAPAAPPAPSAHPPQAQHYITAATGIKLRKPLYGGQDLREMWARLPRGLIPLADAEAASSSSSPSSFVTVGVLVRKEVRRAQGGAGGAYSAWRLADLQGAEATLLLFGEAHERHAGRVCEGSVVAATILAEERGGGGGAGSSRQWGSSSSAAPEEEALEAAEARARGWGGGGGGGGGDDDDDNGLSSLLVPELVPRRSNAPTTKTKRDGPMAVRTGAQLLVLGTSAGFGFCRGTVRATGERCRRAVDTSEGGSSGLCSLHAVGQRSALRAELRRVSGPGGVAVASAAAAASGAPAAAAAAADLAGGAMAGLLAAVAGRGGGGGAGVGGSGAMRPPPASSSSSSSVLADAQRRRAELASRLQRAGGLEPPPDPNDVSAAALAARDRERAREAATGGGGSKAPNLRATLLAQQHQQQQQQQGPRWRQGTAAAAAAALLEGRVPSASQRQPRPSPSAAANAAAAASAAARAALLKRKPGGGGGGGGGGAPKNPANAANAPAVAPRPAQPPPPRGGAGAAAFAAAFGAAVTAPPEDNDGNAPAAARERELAALAAAHADAATNRLLQHYAQKDELAAQLEATTCVRVEAWRCETCGPSRGLAPRRGQGPLLACAQAGHRLVKTTAVKRWWSCASCGWKLTTLGVLLPTGRCPKCRDPSKEFKAETALGGAAERAARAMGFDAETSAVSAGREAMLPRGTEHAFSLNSLRR